jgi:hypothetical protein
VQSSYARATIEELGQALGSLIEQTIRQTGAPQVDVIAFSMGSPTVRAYLSGKQNASGVFQPPDDHKIRKAVFLGGLFFGVGNGHARRLTLKTMPSAPEPRSNGSSTPGIKAAATSGASTRLRLPEGANRRKSAA